MLLIGLNLFFSYLYRIFTSLDFIIHHIQILQAILFPFSECIINVNNIFLELDSPNLAIIDA